MSKRPRPDYEDQVDEEILSVLKDNWPGRLQIQEKLINAMANEMIVNRKGILANAEQGPTDIPKLAWKQIVLSVEALPPPVQAVVAPPSPPPSPVQTTVAPPSPVQTTVAPPSPVQTTVAPPSPVQTTVAPPSPVQTTVVPPSPAQTAVAPPSAKITASPTDTPLQRTLLPLANEDDAAVMLTQMSAHPRVLRYARFMCNQGR